jgi:two-component system, OmpR family, sensor kinase
LKRVELESFIKSFLLFFISLNLLFGAVTYLQYKQNIHNIDQEVYNKMKVCSFDLKCKDIDITFVKKEEQLFYTLHKQGTLLSAYFDIPDSNRYMMKFTLKQEVYLSKLAALKKQLLLRYLFIAVIIALFSLLFSLYALHPLRQALLLTEEFIKDILHDFNTPLSVLRLNANMLKKEIGTNTKIERIEQSVQSVLNLQSNLKAYLEHQTSKAEHFSLYDIITQRVAQIARLYPNIRFSVEIEDISLFYDRDAFTRIIDNLLTNAAKYNKKNGTVTVKLVERTLQIQDSGIGIKNPHKIFQRFYKEHARGIGIGLHIVKKLCDELKIGISLQSQLGEGTTFYLKFD